MKKIEKIRPRPAESIVREIPTSMTSGNSKEILAPVTKLTIASAKMPKKKLAALERALAMAKRCGSTRIFRKSPELLAIESAACNTP